MNNSPATTISNFYRNQQTRGYLTEAALRHFAPSVFTECGAGRTSRQYQCIPTIKVVIALAQKGFMPTAANQCRSRNDENRPFAKHMLRFRHIDARPNQYGLFPEIVLTNSHNGLSAYRLMAGLYRMVCANGLTAGHDYDGISIRHQGNIIDNVIEGTYRVIEDSQQLLTTSEKMMTTTLDEQQRLQFANAAHKLRFADSEVGQAIKPKLLLNRRRYSDDGNDLFTVFNVIQENVIRGGLRSWRVKACNALSRVTTRHVNSIDQANKINRSLWSLAEKMAA